MFPLNVFCYWETIGLKGIELLNDAADALELSMILPVAKLFTSYVPLLTY
jgi:hypothetical protein